VAGLAASVFDLTGRSCYDRKSAIFNGVRLHFQSGEPTVSSLKKPNVLLLMSDEHAAFMSGCYGHRSVKTPAIDSLAERGVLFEAAYCASPICAPSRAAMLTGKCVSSLEVWDNAAPLRSDWPTFAHSFRAAGYYTALCGKMHFIGPDQHHGFEDRWTQDIYPANFDWTQLTREDVGTASGQHASRVLEAGPGRSPDMDYDQEVIFRAEAGLRDLARRENQPPWMLCVSFTGPHYPFNCPEKYWNAYSNDDVDLPEVAEDVLASDPEYVRDLRSYGGFDKLLPEEAVGKALRATMGRVTMIDDYFGRILELLKSLKMDEDTIVIYTSDHGDMLAQRGLWYKNVSYEASARVPLIFAGPQTGRGRVSEPVSHLDLYSSLPALAGIETVYSPSDGRDISDLIRSGSGNGPGRAIMEYYGEGVQRGWRAIRRGDFKLTMVPGTDLELFNVLTDPGETNNLADDPKYQAIRTEMEKELLAGWDHQALQEKCYQSQERRAAIMTAFGSGDHQWQLPSSSPPHPLGFQ
jgi:choline-sulfatase